MISMLKDAANTIMGTLMLVLQLSMSMLEVNPQQAPEEQIAPGLAAQLETMSAQLTAQRNLLQEIKNQMPAGTPVMEMQAPSFLPRGHVTEESDPGLDLDEFSMVSGVMPRMPSRLNNNQPGPAQASTAASYPSAAPAVAAAPENQNLAMVPVGPPAPAAAPALTLAQWGQKRITWGKKRPGKSFYQTVQEDVGYVEWFRARYSSIQPEQRDFVDYACAQLDHDGEMARRQAQARVPRSPPRP